VDKLAAFIQHNDAVLRAVMTVPSELYGNRHRKRANTQQGYADSSARGSKPPPRSLFPAADKTPKMLTAAQCQEATYAPHQNSNPIR